MGFSACWLLQRRGAAEGKGPKSQRRIDASSCLTMSVSHFAQALWLSLPTLKLRSSSLCFCRGCNFLPSHTQSEKSQWFLIWRVFDTSMLIASSQSSLAIMRVSKRTQEANRTGAAILSRFRMTSGS